MGHVRYTADASEGLRRWTVYQFGITVRWSNKKVVMGQLKVLFCMSLNHMARSSFSSMCGTSNIHICRRDELQVLFCKTSLT